MPVEAGAFDNSFGASLRLVKWYAREHVLLCLSPALFIAGAISTFVSHGSVMKYLGPGANKLLAYGVASISGAILAVCSCTVLPLFAGIHRMGAGLGPATAFLYSGPAINVLAIVLTASVLGLELGAARAVGAIVFAVVIGAAMHLIYRRQEKEKPAEQAKMPVEAPARPLWQNALVLASMIAVLVFANWAVSGQLQFGLACCPVEQPKRIDVKKGTPAGEDDRFIFIRGADGQTEKLDKTLLRSAEPLESGAYVLIYNARFFIAAVFLAALLVMLAKWFGKSELAEWGGATWIFAKQIMPLLFAGVLAAGLLFGMADQAGLVPRSWVAAAVGGNSPLANLFAAVAGALMYFATLTEVPIVQGLLSAGMGKGPALALLLAGPALSLPNLLVIRSVIGTQKATIYALLVVVMATISGIIFGSMYG
ncbi:MAG: permease [Planctomycetota bacterium]